MSINCVEISNWRLVHQIFGVSSNVGLPVLSIFTFTALAASMILVVIPNSKLFSLPPQNFDHGMLYTGEIPIIATAGSLDVVVNAALFAYSTFKVHRLHACKASKIKIVFNFSLILVLVAASNSLSKHSDANAHA